jgi:hypothetical protein
MKQGQGPNTRRKEELFARLFRWALYISRGAWPRPYCHTDLTAGCGYNHEAGCPGSPAVFLQTALEVGVPTLRASFCDIDPEAIKQLEAVAFANTPWPDDWEVTARCCDNADFLPLVAAAIEREDRRPWHAVGTCLCDPNGFPHGFPTLALIDFLTRFPKIDPIFNLNCSLFARVGSEVLGTGCKGSKNERLREQFRHWPELGELITAFPRPYWWVSNPPPHKNGGERFITFLGRTLEPDRKKFAGFHPLGSEAGQYIVRRLKRFADDQGLFPFMTEEEP